MKRQTIQRGKPQNSVPTWFHFLIWCTFTTFLSGWALKIKFLGTNIQKSRAEIKFVDIFISLFLWRCGPIADCVHATPAHSHQSEEFESPRTLIWRYNNPTEQCVMKYWKKSLIGPNILENGRKKVRFTKPTVHRTAQRTSYKKTNCSWRWVLWFSK